MANMNCPINTKVQKRIEANLKINDEDLSCTEYQRRDQSERHQIVPERMKRKKYTCCVPRWCLAKNKHYKVLLFSCRLYAVSSEDYFNEHFTTTVCCSYCYKYVFLREKSMYAEQL